MRATEDSTAALGDPPSNAASQESDLLGHVEQAEDASDRDQTQRHRNRRASLRGVPQATTKNIDQGNAEIASEHHEVSADPK